MKHIIDGVHENEEGSYTVTLGSGAHCSCIEMHGNSIDKLVDKAVLIRDALNCDQEQEAKDTIENEKSTQDK